MGKYSTREYLTTITYRMLVPDMMSSKRPAPESSEAPPTKRSALALAPLDIGPAAGEEDLDIKVLKVCSK